MATTLNQLVTADELLEMGDIGRCELIYGELIMMSPAGAEHGVIALRMGRFLGNFVDQHDLGEAFAAETGFKIDSDPDLVRAPDVSFVRKDRIGGRLPKGFFEGAPDLAVEVISPGERKREVAEKIAGWLVHGTTVVWEVSPRTMTVFVHRVGKPTERLGVDDTLREEQMLPGFTLPLTKLFKQP